MTNYFEKSCHDAITSFLSSKDTSDSDDISIVYVELAKQKNLVQCLKNENQHLKGITQPLENENQYLKNENQHLKKENQYLKDENQHLVQRCDALEFELSAATVHINELKQDNHDKDIQIQYQEQLLLEKQKMLALSNRFRIAPGDIRFIDEDQYAPHSCVYIFYGLNSHLLKVGRAKNLKQRVKLYKLTANTQDTHFDSTEEVLLWRLVEYPAEILNSIEAVYRGGLTYLFGTADYGREWWKISDERESVIEKYVALIEQSDVLKRILSHPTDWLNSLYVVNKAKNAITRELIQKRKAGLIDG